MKYDKITDHYAAALEIGKSPEYAARLDMFTLFECLTAISGKLPPDEIEILNGIIHKEKEKRGTREASKEYLKYMHAEWKERKQIETERERREQAAEMLEYMEQVRKEREREKSPDGLKITAKDVVLFYKFFPFEDTERHGMGLYKIWAARHGFNFNSLRNKWSQLQNVKAEGLDRVKVIGPEKVEYLAKLLTEPHHEKTREQILLFVAQYRKEHQKRGP